MSKLTTEKGGTVRLRAKKYTISCFICPKCKSSFPLPRTKRKEKDHIKHLYCYKCKEVVGMTEIRSFDVLKTMKEEEDEAI